MMTVRETVTKAQLRAAVYDRVNAVYLWEIQAATVKLRNLISALPIPDGQDAIAAGKGGRDDDAD